MGLHGGYGNNFIGELGQTLKGKTQFKCSQCGVRFYSDSKMSRLHIIENDIVVRCKRMESLK